MVMFPLPRTNVRTRWITPSQFTNHHPLLSFPTTAVTTFSGHRNILTTSGCLLLFSHIFILLTML
ncbi:uncharacterized protein DS421_10g296930 [Arachis hypogaea]|nr:uncharacterized protein DS421_10g296930 [Arachis hypogaea]